MPFSSNRSARRSTSCSGVTASSTSISWSTASGRPRAASKLAGRGELARAQVGRRPARGLDQPVQRLGVVGIVLEGSEERRQVGHRERP